MSPREAVSYLFIDAVAMETLDTGNTDVDKPIVVVVNSTITMATSLVSLNYNLPTMVAVATVLFVVIIATAIGNLLVGLALFRYQYLRTISNYLIGNLALSDFLLATTIFPLSTVNECLGHWIFGRAMCNIWLLTDVLYCTASLWNICVIAFDRFTATLYPIWYREKRSTRRAALYVATVWFIASSICVPPLLGWNDLTQNYIYDNITDVYFCVLFETPSYVLYSASGSFFVPFFLTVFLYVQIFIVLRKRMAKMRASKAKSSSSSSPAAAAASRHMNSRLPPAAQKHQSNDIKHVDIPETELEMTSFILLSKKGEGGGGGGEGGVAAEEGSLNSFLSSDSGDDRDQNRPLQGGRSLKGRGRNPIDRSPTAGVGAARRGRATVSLGPKKCSVRFLTGLKLVHWTLSSPNSGRRSPSEALPPTPSVTPSMTSRSFDLENRIQVIRDATIADNDTDNQTTKLVYEEDEEEEEEETSGKDGEDGEMESKKEREPQRQRRGRPTNGCNRRHSTLLGRIFKHRGLPWKSNWSSSNSNSRQGSTASSNSSSIKPASAAGCVAPQPVVLHLQQQHRRFDQKEMQATIRMAIIIAFFCGMWLGFFVVYVVHGWCPGCAVPRELEAFFFWLGYSNSSINPILYTIFNEDFRKAFQKILGCYRKHEPNSTGSSSTPKH